MTQLKKQIITEIEKINDEKILVQLSELLIASDPKMKVVFNNEQIKDIKTAQKEVEYGKSLYHEDLMKLMKND